MTTDTSFSFGPYISALAAVVSVICAILSYRLNKSIRLESLSDDRLVFGKVWQASLQNYKHAQCVVQFEVFNKSKRKATIESLFVYDSGNKKVPIAWSQTIDKLGTPQTASDMVGITDRAMIYIRRDDGEPFGIATISFKHSFSEVRVQVRYDPYSEFVLSGNP